ncbi:MAG: dUTP diphosphatase [Candidatus Nanoarchaeia archaeon]|nr:dUTP diphosphatase [Candidatus Nanoarchaeia archaeon]
MIRIKQEKSETSLKVKRLFKDAELPEYALNTDIGIDIRANETVVIPVSEQKTIKTGLAIEIPEGHVGLIRDRAGIITKMGVHTAAGTFDPAYRGEVSIVLVNCGEQDVEVEKGMRIAQMIILPVTKAKIQEVKQLSSTERGERGFSSTGLKKVIKKIDKIKK